MRDIETTLTQRGQVTVPAEVRRLLGLKARDKVSFTIDDGVVQLRAATFTLETAFGSVPPLDPPMPVEEMVRVAKDERARRYADKLRSR
jgi:AbrB family looped-hinge helix DNA binding protein